MRSLELLGQARTADGSDLTLTRHSTEYVILANGKSLMSSRMHGSEEALATFACKSLRTRERASSVGGWLGDGIHPARDVGPSSSKVIRPCGGTAGSRCGVEPWPPWTAGRASAERQARPREPLATLRLRCDPTPAGSMRCSSTWTTGPPRSPRRATHGSTTTKAWPPLVTRSRPAAYLAVWSARDDRKFQQRLRYGGFAVEVEHVRGRLKKGGPHHTIFVAHRT